MLHHKGRPGPEPEPRLSLGVRSHLIRVNARANTLIMGRNVPSELLADYDETNYKYIEVRWVAYVLEALAGTNNFMTFTGGGGFTPVAYLHRVFVLSSSAPLSLTMTFQDKIKYKL